MKWRKSYTWLNINCINDQVSLWYYIFNFVLQDPYTKLIQNKNSKFWVLGVIYRKPNASIYNLFIISTVIILFILFYISVSTYQKYKCVEVTECKLYMRVDDTKNYKRDNPVSMTMRITKLIYYLPAIVPIEGAVLFELLLMLIVLIRSK
jgi:hypothetical protein